MEVTVDQTLASRHSPAKIADRAPGSAIAASGAGSARIGAFLTVLLGIPVFGFFATAAFAPQKLAVPVIPGQPMTIWFIYGLALIAFAVLLGGVYVFLANRSASSRARGLVALFGALLLTAPAHAEGPGGGGANATCC